MNKEELELKMRRAIGSYDNQLVISTAKDCVKVAEDYAAMKLEEYKQENELAKSRVSGSCCSNPQIGSHCNEEFCENCGHYFNSDYR